MGSCICVPRPQEPDIPKKSKARIPHELQNIKLEHPSVQVLWQDPTGSLVATALLCLVGTVSEPLTNDNALLQTTIN